MWAWNVSVYDTDGLGFWMGFYDRRWGLELVWVVLDLGNDLGDRLGDEDGFIDPNEMTAV